MLTDAIVKRIPDYENVKDERVRGAYGMTASVVGVSCNVLLFAGKLLAGLLSGSVAIMADAVNNLSDASSSLISLIGFKLADKPADAEHPYGHGRYEYLSGLMVAVMILAIGVELLKSSVEKIFSPEPVVFSILTVIILAASILVKLWMMFFNRNIGRRIDSTTLEATASDSRNDVITTGAVLLCTILAKKTGLDLDGYVGAAVAVFILISGFSLVRDTLDPLLGKAPSPETVRHIRDKIMAYPGVLGVHDLMIHDYGPGRRYASIHVEIDKNEDPMACHARIDRMERECLKNYGTHLVIHYDPVVTDDPEVNSTKRLVNTIIKVRDGRLTIHDFRMKDDGESVKMSFDMILPEDLRGQEQSIKETVEKALNSLDSKKYYADITFDMESEGAKED